MTQPPRERPLIEAVLEGSEVVVDLLTTNEVVASIPVVGSAFKVCKAVDAIRDKIFMAKLSQFFVEIDKTTPKTKEKIREKIAESEEDANNIGEALLLTIERVTDSEKPKILAYVFLAYIDGVVTSEEFRRLSAAIDSAFCDDLKRVLSTQSLPGKSADAWLEYLTPSGLTRLVVSEIIADIGKRYFEPTALANKLRNAYFHGLKAATAK